MKELDSKRNKRSLNRMKQNYKCLYEHDYGTWMEFQGISVFIFVKLKILEEILSMCSKKPDYWLSLLEIMQTN